MTPKIALGMPTVRAHAGKVASLFASQLSKALGTTAAIDIYFAIDPPLTPRWRPTEDQPGHRVHVIDTAKRSRMVRHLVNLGSDEVLTQALLGGSSRGYAAARNSIVAQAVADGICLLVFFDDDVVPFVPVCRAPDGLVWRRSIAAQEHIRNLKDGADVSRGQYVGHISPIVQHPETVIDRESAAALSFAFSMANDLLRDDCFTGPNLARKIELTPYPQTYHSADAVFLGGSLGLSVSAFARGHLPPFFSPVGARGEDTFFGHQLPPSLNIRSIVDPVFHDPFNMYPMLKLGEFPLNLSNPPELSKSNIERAAKAMCGWLAYGPLWLRCAYDDERERDGIAATVLQILDDNDASLRQMGVRDAANLFRRHLLKAEGDYKLMYSAGHCWKSVIMPLLAARRIQGRDSAADW